MDFGSQNIYGELPRQVVEGFLAVFSSKDRYSSDLVKPGTKVEALMAAANFDYVAFDVYSGGKTRKFDLNYQALPDSLCGTFDLVANLGTSEHVANQYNVFKIAHDALKVGGVMYNAVPFYGGVDHGLVNYHPKFFTTLIANNSYEPLRWYFSDIFAGSSDFYLEVSAAANGAMWEGEFTGSALMDVIFKKITASSFRPPTDAVLEGDKTLQHPTVNTILKRSSHAGPDYRLPATRAHDAGSLHAKLPQLRIKADDLRRDTEIELLRRQIEAMRSSKSWKITAPLRSFRGWMKRFY